MYIKKISEIINYRNLTGLTISFNPNINFIIGENNIGKTNTLELITSFFSTGKFTEEDFNEITESIKIKLIISFSDEEIGFFEDNFDVDESNEITIEGIQESVDERLVYYHCTPCRTKISASIIRKINTLYYYAQRMPSKEVDFRKTSGSGKVLNYLIEHSLIQNDLSDEAIIQSDKLTSVVDNINSQIEIINKVTGDHISAFYDIEAGRIISRILGLGDETGRDINLLGEGIQYAFNILLQIIEKIYSVKTSRKPEEFENRLIITNDKKLFPLFLVLDEPEIHQHPYRQRSLIKKIKSIMRNEIPEFTILLNNLFGIDGIMGQLFIATHSPNILSDDYRQFIRISKTSNGLNIISGEEIIIQDEKIYKHMLHNFIYLKEAMFSRGIIFIEGDTENGAIPILAERNDYNLDELGIGVVKLDGADGVKKCMSLYSLFNIKSVAAIDRDKETSYRGIPNIFFTNKIDFEEELYDNFKFKDYFKCCVELKKAKPLIDALINKGFRINHQTPIEDICSLQIDESLGIEIMTESKVEQLKELRHSKNAAKGSILANFVTTVPASYLEAIQALISEEQL